MDKELIKKAFQLGYKAGMKKHAAFGPIKDLIPRLAGHGERYWELLRGGNNSVVGNYRKIMGNLKTMAARSPVGTPTNTFIAEVRNAFDAAARSGNSGGFKFTKTVPGFLEGMFKGVTKDGGGDFAAMAAELAKVRRARVATALGALGIGGYGTYKYFKNADN